MVHSLADGNNRLFLLEYNIGMTHPDHVRLLQKLITPKKQIWADFGSGDGAFTLALSDLGGSLTEIYSFDTDESRLSLQKKKFGEMFPVANVHFLPQDFTKPLDLPVLDGIIMANSLHYLENQALFLVKIKEYLKPSGLLVIVEYNVDYGNRWVPYPVSFRKLEALCQAAGFTPPVKLGAKDSDFLKEIYSAYTSQK